jgi:hypothetical protein
MSKLSRFLYGQSEMSHVSIGLLIVAAIAFGSFMQQKKCDRLAEKNK